MPLLVNDWKRLYSYVATCYKVNFIHGKYDLDTNKLKNSVGRHTFGFHEFSHSLETNTYEMGAAATSIGWTHDTYVNSKATGPRDPTSNNRKRNRVQSRVHTSMLYLYSWLRVHYGGQ